LKKRFCLFLNIFLLIASMMPNILLASRTLPPVNREKFSDAGDYINLRLKIMQETIDSYDWEKRLPEFYDAISQYKEDAFEIGDKLLFAELVNQLESNFYLENVSECFKLDGDLKIKYRRASLMCNNYGKSVDAQKQLHDARTSLNNAIKKTLQEAKLCCERKLRSYYSAN